MRALVTGASSGIGRALALELVRHGYEVCAVARRAEALATLQEEARTLGGVCTPEVLDVGDTDHAVARIRALDTHEPFDLVIANAGVGAAQGVDATSWEAVRDAFHINFCGAAATLTALTGAMVQRGHGHLVGIGSFASFGPLPQAAAYCSPKAGLTMLLGCLDLDLAGTGVAVTDVRLGFVRTSMIEASTHPKPQLLEPEDAARRVVLGLQKRPRTLTIPQPLGAGAWTLAHMPRSVAKVIARRLPRR